MDLSLLIGWVATLTGSILGIPQAYRIHRTRSVQGVSVWSWQVTLAVNLGWGTHGVLIAAPNLIVVNVFGLACTLTILALIARTLSRPLPVVLLPGLGLAALMVTTDIIGGSAAFGLVAIIPGLLALLAQTVQLVRAPSVRGVSAPFLVLTFANFALWGTWGHLVGDPGTVITNILTSAVSAFNLAWLVVRRLQTGALSPSTA